MEFGFYTMPDFSKKTEMRVYSGMGEGSQDPLHLNCPRLVHFDILLQFWNTW